MTTIDNINIGSAKQKKGIYVASFGLKVFLLVFWVIAIILPLITMLSTIANTDIIKIITSERFITAAINSVIVSSISTVISMTIAAILAWCTCRTAIKYKEAFSVIFTVPMLIPSISHGMGMIILFGSNGILKNILNLDVSIYGFHGIVLGSVMYSFPVAYLMIADILKLEDSTPYEAASVMGLSKINKFTAITLPYMKKPLISVFFATFTMIITDYGVPLMVGGKCTTLPVMMYQDVIGMLDFGKGSVIGIILLIPALIACLLDMFNRDKGECTYVHTSFRLDTKYPRDIFAYIICIAASITIFLPIITFVCLSFIDKYPIDMSITFKHIQQALQMNIGEYILNSVIISIFVSVLGVLLAIICAYFTSRTPSKFSKTLHLLSIIPLSIPGIVLGLSYVMFFKSTFIYGTFAILILVNTIHFFSSPYLMMYNTFNKLNSNFEAVGKTLGISRFRIIIDVLIPLSKGTIAEMISYFFVNSMMTISAVSFLAAIDNKPVSLLITQFEGQMQLELAAFVSLAILAINTIMKVIIFVIKKYAIKN